MPSLRTARLPGIGLALALALMVLTMVVPAVTGWDVHVNFFPPLHADWAPRLGVGTVPAVVLAGLAVRHGEALSRTLTWRRLLVAVFVAGLAWMFSLAFVDGTSGIGHILNTNYEYLNTARSTTDLSATLHEYIAHIRTDSQPFHWPVHIAGHPPGALVFFIVLVHLGLGSGFAAGTVVTVFAASTAVAVMVTTRILGAEDMARRAAPFLVFGPAAIWQAVSADAMFAAFAAWGVAALAVAATRRSVLWSLVAGLLLGYCVMMSYGLPLLGLLALAVLVLARSWFPLPFVAAAAVSVVLAFAVAGFVWWEALPAIHDRYWDAVAGRRPSSYWLFGDLAAFLFSAGPMAAAGVALLVGGFRRHLRDPSARVVAVLSTAGVAMVLAADLSLMSKGEVERIWLPFVPWVLLSCALLPQRWRRRGLVVQVVLALVVQHLLNTGW